MPSSTATMPSRPIFVATHPRSCSTAFERVFMTCRDTLQCAHEPFGDSFYYGPERLSPRYRDEAVRVKSGFSQTTYQDVVDRLDQAGGEGKRVFIKDMIYYLMPPGGQPAQLAPSLCTKKLNGSVNGRVNGSVNGTHHVNGVKSNGVAKAHNPTVLPLDVLKKYQWTFLIRHPRRSIPSFYRCTIPPLDQVTGFPNFMPSEAGYAELRMLFDYLREQNLVGPHLAGQPHRNSKDEVRITVIDADDLLDHPQEVIEAFCKETGIDFTPDMLQWDNTEDQEHVEQAFAKWIGFHNDAIKSTSLSPRTKPHKTVTEETEDREWREKYGEKGQRIIRACVNENVPHYEYLKQFALKI